MLKGVVYPYTSQCQSGQLPVSSRALVPGLFIDMTLRIIITIYMYVYNMYTVHDILYAVYCAYMYYVSYMQ